MQLFELAIGLTLAAVISTVFRIAYDRAALRVDGRAGGGHAAAVMDRVLRLPESALRFGPADLALRVASADQVRRTLSNVVLSTIPALFLSLVNGALLFYYAHWAALVAVGCFLLLCGLSALFARLQREAQRRGEQLESDVFNIVFQLVQAIGVLRTTGSEVRAFAHWGIDFAELRARSYKARKLSTVFEMLLSGIDLICWAGIFLLLALLPSDHSRPARSSPSSAPMARSRKLDPDRAQRRDAGRPRHVVGARCAAAKRHAGTLGAAPRSGPAQRQDRRYQRGVPLFA